ncbi:MAG TPA: LysM domain-containing protein [Burkholderiales bacterium]|nr:LysM domain-containing protein [Burkholderiales bacterium]
MRKAIISLIFLLSFVAATIAATSGPVLQPSAPDRYTVVPGDTLWGIAVRFLRDPWRWPELWKMNAQQIRNPHRIYPGDTLVLDRSGGQLRMRLEQARVGPRARIEPRDADAIQTISPSVIEPFLSKPMVVSENELNSSPEIVATQEDRVALGPGAVAYVRGVANTQETRWQLFRRGDPLIDPDTKQLLGYIAVYLGEAELRRRGELSTIEITKAVQEVYRGDRLVPTPPDPPIFAYVPHAPQNQVQGRIVSTYGGLWETGPLAIVTLSRGKRDGLEVGHVLALYRDQRSARYADRTEPLFGRQGPSGDDKRIPYYPADLPARGSPLFKSAPPVREEDFAQLPAERYGLLMVFRTFERASFALVMQASRPVSVADIIANP